MEIRPNAPQATTSPHVPGPEAVAARFKGQLAPVFLTLVSVIQGVALLTLVSRVEANSQHFTLTNWLLATTAFIYFVAVWNEYLMGYLAYIFMPALLNTVIPFAFLAVEVFLAYFVFADQRAYALAFGIGAGVGLAQYLDTTARVRAAIADNPIYPAIARWWWMRIGLAALLAAGAVVIWAFYDTVMLGNLQVAVALVFLVGTSLFLLFSVPFWNAALAYANGKRS